MAKNKVKVEVEVELVDYFKIVLHNNDTHAGYFYLEDEWDITIYSPTIEYLIEQATKQMAVRLINVNEWELVQCQVLIYNDNVYEVKDSAKDIAPKYNTFVDDILSNNSYKEARQKEEDALLEHKRHFRKNQRKKYKASKKNDK